MKIIFITPYYKEPRELIEKNIQSVKRQTHKCDHLLIAEGFPQDWINEIDGVRHIKLDQAHADYGNTPRAIGGLLATSEGYDAIGMLDADNWLEPEHVETCISAAKNSEYGLTKTDYVIAQRNFRRPDDTIMPIPEEPNHVDTNCFFFLRGSFHVLPHWGLMPREISGVGDRIFHSMIKSKNLKFATNIPKTVNYLSLWKSHYSLLGEQPPIDSKENINSDEIISWILNQSSHQQKITNNLCGIKINV